MNINTKDMSFVKFDGKEMDWIKFNGVIVYEGWKELTKSGVPPLKIYSSGADLINYKMYGNSRQDGIPTPESPIEVESVGVKTHNLYDEKEYPLVDNRYINYTDGSCLASSTNLHKANEKYCPIKPNTTYSLNYRSTGGLTGIAFYDKDKVFISGVRENVNFTTPSNAKYIRFTVPIEAENVQLNEGATILDFVPFGYKIPVKVRGNNLLPSNVLDANSYTSGYNEPYDTVYKLPFIVPNKTYTISFDYNKQSNTYYYLRQYADGVNDTVKYLLANTSSSGKKVFTFTAEENVEYYLYGQKATYFNASLRDISNFQIEEGTENTDYQPYIEPTITNIYLYEPLRKQGDYMDYIDFGNNKVYRVIQRIYIKDLDWTKHPSYSNIYSEYRDMFQTRTGLNPMSNLLDNTAYAPSDSIAKIKKDYCIKFHATSPSLYISDSVHTTKEEMKDYLGDGYIEYISSTPTEETIELPNIKTLKGNVIIEIVDDIQPSNMEIVYKGKEVK